MLDEQPEQQQQQQQHRPPLPRQQPRVASRLLSQCAGDYFEDLCRDGAAAGTLSETRYAIFYLFEFLAADPSVAELRGRYLRNGQAAKLRRSGQPLPPNLMAEFLSWLRRTPSRPRKSGKGGRGGVPGEINPGTVKLFFSQPPSRKIGGRLRGEQTVGKYRRTVAPLLDLLGLSRHLRRGQRPKTKLAPVLLPKPAAVAGWWDYYLSRQTEGWNAVDAARPPWRQRQRVVLLQALLQLSGMRLFESLTASIDDLDGHWLLLRITKTKTPRLIYLNSQALVIGSFLRLYNKRHQPALFGELENSDAAARAKRFAGWPYSESRWHKLVAESARGYGGWLPEKQHQIQRQILSSFMRHPSRCDAEAESVQLGHGGNLVLNHYEAALQRLPGLLEPLALPPIGIPWPPPAETPTDVSMPLYAELRRLLSGRAADR